MKWNHLKGGAARRISLAAATCMGLVLGACTTMGTGSGETTPGDQPVSFTWNSKDGGVTGQMSATITGGAVFTGPYLEITSSTQSDAFYPMWRGWEPGWRDWQPITTTTYSGKVVANLQGPASQRMRCHFDLVDPRAGMGGGGQGQCQVRGGTTVDASFPHA